MERMQQWRCCVLIPTYNNEKSLARVLRDVLRFTSNIIVVNDGATDGTLEILQGFSKIHQIHLEKNQGKGKALRTGFTEALDKGYEYAITMDSDGQHFADDIPVFLDALENEATKNVLYIGARNMAQADVPGKSSFGNKFSNFWFWFETGTWLEDTQCGFRLYPLKEIEKLSLYTPKFEFEIEVIVKASWNGTLVKNVPVKIVYDDVDRVSHFRTVPDFTRISILNTWFVLVTIFYIKPRDFFRKVKKKGIKKFLLNDVLGSKDTPAKKASSIALGVFIGLSPLWGLHTLLVLFLSFLLKLNKPIAFAFSNVSLPPFIPFIVLASLQTGSWILGESFTFSLDSINENFNFLIHLKAYLLGSMVLALTGALLLGGIGYLTLTFFGKRKMAVNNG
ncbi:glycosyltransferase [Maribacter sp. 4G9]|nr:glycosyltransferase [Maribacter sp. 4G9]